MSAPTLVPVPLRLRRPAPPPRVPLRTLAALALRQHRLAPACLALVLGVLTEWTLLVVQQVRAARAQWQAADCAHGLTDVCRSAMDRATEVAGSVQHLELALLAVPALIGVFVAAPLVPREAEQGTLRLAWTQSVTRRRWLTGHLLVLGGAATVFGLVCSPLGSYLHGAATPALNGAWSPYDPFAYNASGPLPAFASLAAVGIGVLAGVCWRRTVPAMASALACQAALIGALTWLRSGLVPLRHLVTTHGYELTADDWLVRDGVVLPDGHRLSYAQCAPNGCPAGSRTFEDYHDAAQLWPMQWTEAGILAVLTVAAVVAAYRLLPRITP